MKKLIKGVMFLALVGTIMVGCEKEEDFSSNQQNDNTHSKVKTKKNKSEYPIIIYEDLTIQENLESVITNLEDGELLYSTIVNDVHHNEIRLNSPNDDFPDDPDPDDPEITFGCAFPDPYAACLASIAFWHNYNLDHCEGSSTGYSNGTLWVHGWGCDETA